MNQSMRDLDPGRAAWALLTCLAAPADPVLPGLLAVMDPGQILACIRSGTVPARIAEGLGDLNGLRPMLDRWRTQLAHLPADGGIADAHRAGIRLICPGDAEWPPGLHDLGPAHRPFALWARGISSLAGCCAASVAIVGSRAATAYGHHVATELAADLTGRGLTIISGAAYGIDGAAHRGALAAGGCTVAVLACGPDIACPRGHAGLLGHIADRGLIVSECPPGRQPTRAAFLSRNRILAALATGGMVVVEAGLHSGTMHAVGQADLLSRPVMAVPGPVTSAASAGCHHLIAECGVPLVASAADVLTHLGCEFSVPSRSFQ